MLTSTGISLLVNESARCFFHAGRLLWNTVVCTVRDIRITLPTHTQMSTRPHTSLTSPQENFHDLELLLSLAFLVQQVRLKLCPKYGGREGWLSVVSCPDLLVSVTHGYK